MQMYAEEASPSAEFARELNAVYGLRAFARARCYPPALTARLDAMLQSYLTAPVEGVNTASLN
jgi:hypothetical protein